MDPVSSLELFLSGSTCIARAGKALPHCAVLLHLRCSAGVLMVYFEPFWQH